MKNFTIHFDGSCAPKNPGGEAAYGYIITEADQIVKQESKVIGTGPWTSNNLAEFYAVAAALSAIYGDEKFANETLKGSHISVYGDSKLVVNILNKKRRANKATLYFPAACAAMKALIRLRKLGVSVSFDWIPRNLNKKADELSRVLKK